MTDYHDTETGETLTREEAAGRVAERERAARRERIAVAALPWAQGMAHTQGNGDDAVLVQRMAALIAVCQADALIAALDGEAGE